MKFYLLHKPIHLFLKRDKNQIYSPLYPKKFVGLYEELSFILY